MWFHQLSEKTRIGFRDAFYRLAKNAEQYMENHSQNGDLVSDTVHDETLRYLFYVCLIGCVGFYPCMIAVYSGRAEAKRGSL